MEKKETVFPWMSWEPKNLKERCPFCRIYQGQFHGELCPLKEGNSFTNKFQFSKLYRETTTKGGETK